MFFCINYDFIIRNDSNLKLDSMFKKLVASLNMLLLEATWDRFWFAVNLHRYNKSFQSRNHV